MCLKLAAAQFGQNLDKSRLRLRALEIILGRCPGLLL